MINLFVYGTLQSGQSRNYILKEISFERAQIQDFKKVKPSSLGYPFIMKQKGSLVNGEVYFNLPESLLDKIDSIEGEGVLYHRILVDVSTVSGNVLQAFVYYPSKELIKSYISD